MPLPYLCPYPPLPLPYPAPRNLTLRRTSWSPWCRNSGEGRTDRPCRCTSHLAIGLGLGLGLARVRVGVRVGALQTEHFIVHPTWLKGHGCKARLIPRRASHQAWASHGYEARPLHAVVAAVHIPPGQGLV